MFDIAWSEIFVILVITVLLIGPKELPAVIATCRKIIHKAKALSREFTKMLAAYDILPLQEEARKLNQEIKHIVDLEGQLQETYDISDLLKEDEHKQISNALPEKDKKEH